MKKALSYSLALCAALCIALCLAGWTAAFAETSAASAKSSGSAAEKYVFGFGTYEVAQARDMEHGERDVTDRVSGALLLFDRADEAAEPYFFLTYSHGSFSDYFNGTLAFGEVYGDGAYFYYGHCEDGRTLAMIYDATDDTVAIVTEDGILVICEYSEQPSSRTPSGTYTLAKATQGGGAVDLGGYAGTFKAGSIKGTNALSFSCTLDGTSSSGRLILLGDSDDGVTYMCGIDGMPVQELISYDPSKDEIVMYAISTDTALYFEHEAEKPKWWSGIVSGLEDQWNGFKRIFG